MTPTILTAALLQELDRALERIDAPITGLWRPGLTDAEMDALTEPIGIQLPAEARTWWAWHDGVTYDPQTRLAATLGDGWEVPPLSDAVEDAIRARDLSAQIAAKSPPGEFDEWRDSWITFVGVEPPERLACECAPREGEAAPVVHYDPMFNLTPSNYKAASMGDVVTVWLQAIDDGTWHIDPDTGRFAWMDPVALAKAKGEDIAALL